MNDGTDPVVQELDDEMVLSAAMVHRQEDPARPRRVVSAGTAQLTARLTSPHGRLTAPSAEPVKTD
jgi:hypothetical protein